MNPKHFLQVGGIVLVIMGILGFSGVIGPTSAQSVFGPRWWFDNAENWAHLVLGIVGLLASFIFSSSLQKAMVILVGIAGLAVGLYSAFVNTSFLGANFENPADTVLYFLIAVWALFAGFHKEKVMAQGM